MADNILRWTHSFGWVTETPLRSVDFVRVDSPVIIASDAETERATATERSYTDVATATDAGSSGWMGHDREPATTTATAVDTGSTRATTTERFATELATASELVTHGSIIVNTDLAIAADFAKLTYFSRSNTDLATATDSAKQNSFIRRNTDVATAADSLGEVDVTVRISSNNAVTASDAGSIRSVTSVFVRTDLATTTSSHFRTPGRGKTSSETVIATTGHSYLLSRFRSKTETVTGAVGAFRIYGYLRTTTVGATVVDSLVRGTTTSRLNTDLPLGSDAGTHRAVASVFIKSDTATATDSQGAMEQTVSDRYISIRNIKTVETVVFEPGATDEYGSWGLHGNFLSMQPNETKNIPPAYLCNSPSGARTRLGVMMTSGLVSVAESYLNTSRVLPATAIYNYSVDTNPMIQFILHRAKTGAVSDADPTVATSGIYSQYDAMLLRCMFDGTIGTGETADVYVWGRELYATSKGPWAIIYSHADLLHGEEIEIPTRKRYIWVQLKGIVLAATGVGVGVWVSGY